MVQNNNFSVLPFYTSLNEQAHRMPYAYGDIYPLYCAVGTLPTFQIFGAGSSASSVVIYKANGGLVGNISPSLN